MLLNIDVCFKVVRTDTCLGYLKDLSDKASSAGREPKDAIQQALTGCTVVTRYNQKTYKIDRVDFA